jgi:hypothetical protein
VPAKVWVSATHAAPLRVELVRAATIHVRVGQMLRGVLAAGARTASDAIPHVLLRSLDELGTQKQDADPPGAVFNGLRPGRYRIELKSTQAPPREVTVTGGELLVVEF